MLTLLGRSLGRFLSVCRCVSPVVILTGGSKRSRPLLREGNCRVTSWVIIG